MTKGYLNTTVKNVVLLSGSDIQGKHMFTDKIISTHKKQGQKMDKVAYIRSEDEFEGEVFSDLDLQELSLDDKAFYSCQFRNCTMGHCHFNRCRFEDCQFDTTDLTLVKLNQTAFQDVEFKNCKLMGIDWRDARQILFQVAFFECTISYGSFVGMPLQETHFIDCTAEEVNFTDALLNKARFSGTRLSGSYFEGADLRQADLSTATDYIIDPQKTKLQKTKFSLQGLLQTAKLQGIVVPEFG